MPSDKTKRKRNKECEKGQKHVQKEQKRKDLEKHIQGKDDFSIKNKSKPKN